MDWNIKETDLDGIKLTTSLAPPQPSATICIRMNAGSYDEYPNHASGAAHFFEHAPLEGSDHFPGHAFDHAGAIKSTINANTSYEYTEYFITVPVEYWREGLRLVADVAQRATLDSQEIIEERDTVINEIRRQAKKFPQRKFQLFVDKKFYDNDPRIGEIMGERDSIAKMETGHLAKFRDEYYVRENCHVVVEGPIAHEEVIGAVQYEFDSRENFKSLEHGKPNERPPFKASGGYHLYPVQEDEDTQFFVFFPLDPKELSRKNFTLAAILAMYFNHPASPVFDDMRNKNRLVYGIDTSLTWSRSQGALGVECISAPERTEEYLQKLIQHAMTVVTGALNQKDFDTLKSIYEEHAKAELRREVAGIDNIYWSHACDGHVTKPDEIMQVITGITFDEFQNFARSTFAKPSTFIANGAIGGIVSKQRFEEILSPLTVAAGAHLAQPPEPEMLREDPAFIRHEQR